MSKHDVKILLFDIETVPDLVWAWSLWDARALEVKEHWKIICFAASWYGSGKILCKALPDYTGNTLEKEYSLMQVIHTLFEEADIIVAHNGVSFDIKKVNAKFIEHGFDPPSPYKVVDTKTEIARVAKFSSNKLEWLSKQLGMERKTEHNGWPLWRGCIEDDKKSWALMKKYNMQDIVVLGQLYECISPWIRQPNAQFWKHGLVCVNPECGSKNIEQRGYFHAQTRTYKRFVCRDCGKWGRATTSEKGKVSVTEV